MSDVAPKLSEAVPFLFGLADREQLPGTALTRLLSDLGASESAARSTLARLRADGALRSSRHGRQTDYALAGVVRESFLRARDVGHGPAARRPWSGEFHGLLLTVPESDRSHRDRFRSEARLVGYAPLRPGLLIAVADGWTALAATVASLPRTASAVPLTLRLSPEDSVTAAEQAWRLSRVAANTSALAASLHRSLQYDATDPTGPEALRRYATLALPAYRFFVGIPSLPVELLPADWPMPRLVAALGAVGERYGPAAAAHLEQVLTETVP